MCLYFWPLQRLTCWACTLSGVVRLCADMCVVKYNCRELCWGSSCQGRIVGNDGHASLCVFYVCMYVCAHERISVMAWKRCLLIRHSSMYACKLPGASGYVWALCLCVCVPLFVCLWNLSLTVCQKSFLIVVKRWQARVSLIYHSPSTHTKVGYMIWQVFKLLSDSTLVSEVTDLEKHAICM